MPQRMKADTWPQFSIAVLLTIADIVLVWATKIWRAATAKPQSKTLLDQLTGASDFETWFEAASGLDDLPESYKWRANPVHKQYDYRSVEERRKRLYTLRRAESTVELMTYLRHGLLRSMYGITRLTFFDKTYANSKESIHLYIDETVDSIRCVARATTRETTSEGRLSTQDLLDNIHDASATFGHTALMLQGGSIFGLCHLGVVKALLEHDILPKVIVGTATGALMAALVGIHTREELPTFLSGKNIDLSAFAASSTQAKKRATEENELLDYPRHTGSDESWFSVLSRRVSRYFSEGFVLDPELLNECVKANVGDLTFEEAFNRTGCILNIIVSSSSEEIPCLMNYLTAPNVLIRSAAMASHVTNLFSDRSSKVQILSKTRFGQITATDLRAVDQVLRTKNPQTSKDHPTRRLRQQFNIEHFIICQARPYIAPFIQPSLPYIRGKDRAWLPRMTANLFKHTLTLLEVLNCLPETLSRILSDERIQGDKFILVPEINLGDWRRLLKNPTKEEIDYWVLKGERAVWSSLCALKVLMAVEVALSDAWEVVRRRRRAGMNGNVVDGRASLAVLPPQPAYMADAEEDWAPESKRQRNLQSSP